VGEALEEEAAEFGRADAHTSGKRSERAIFGACQRDNEVFGAFLEGPGFLDGVGVGSQDFGVGLGMIVNYTASEEVVQCFGVGKGRGGWWNNLAEPGADDELGDFGGGNFGEQLLRVGIGKGANCIGSGAAEMDEDLAGRRGKLREDVAGRMGDGDPYVGRFARNELFHWRDSYTSISFGANKSGWSESGFVPYDFWGGWHGT
jgi:hypothetical protein